jgi:IstB-like ATP binding protein
MALDRRGAELLFRSSPKREEKNSVAIASNESFGGWTKTFTDPRLYGAGSRDRRRAGWAHSPRDVRLWRLAPRFGDAEHWE